MISERRINVTEEVISMILGLAIVIVIAFLIFNFVSKRRGNVEVPGITSTTEENDNNLVSEAKEEEHQEPNIYTVSANDNLWKIAQAKYNDGYMWVKIAKENGLSNPGLLKAGQKLVLPTIETEQKVVVENKEQSIEESEYTVVKGDNLWKIAVRAYGDGYQWTRIWESNKDIVKNPNVIEKGMKLSLPRD